MNVSDWLAALGLARYAQAFADNDIDFDVLSDLSEADLERLGVSLGHRKKFMKALEALKLNVRAFGPPGTVSPQTKSDLNVATAMSRDNVVDFESAIEGERKQVTVLFADLVGSTQLMERMDAEESATLLAPYLEAMLACLRRYDGTVTRVMGDGVVALFGAPAAQEDHAVRACYAALDMQRSIDLVGKTTRGKRNDALKARVGLNSGDVVVKSVGDKLHMDYDAIGVPVNLASRMEQTAAPGTIQITARTLAAAMGSVKVEGLGPMTVKGISEPTEIFRLVGVNAGWSRFTQTMRQGVARLIGRENELAFLEQALNRARAGDGQIVAAVGEAGTGKSRLYFEFVRNSRARNVLVLACGAVAFRASTPWTPIIDLMRGYFAIEDEDGPQVVVDKVVARVSTLDAGLAPWSSALRSLLGVPADDPAWDALLPLQRRARMQMAIKALILREAADRPVIAMFEDLHWADEASLELIESLMEGLTSSKLLILVNYRPEFQHGWSGHSAYTQIRVPPLGRDSAKDLLDALMGDEPTLGSLKGRIAERAQGNALFLEETVRSLVEAGTLRGDRGGYRTDGEAMNLELPATIQSVVAARIDRLNPADKKALCAAAVIGIEIPHDLLSAVIGTSDQSLEQSISHLKGAELLYEKNLFPEIVYAFKHALIHDVALMALLKGQRRKLHLRVGEAMERLYPSRQMELAEANATHLAEGEAWSRALQHYVRAIEHAKSQYSVGHAVELCDLGLACASHVADSAMHQRRILVLLGDLWSQRDVISKANEAYLRALELSTEPAARQIIENKVHRQAYARRDNARISFYKHGWKGKTIVLSSPVSYGQGAYQPVVDRMCQEFRLVTIDSRGIGDSDPLAPNWTLFEDLEDVRAVIEELKGDSVTVVGISHTGAMVVALAAKYPHLLDRAVVIGGSFGKPTTHGGVSWMRNWADEIDALLVKGDYAGAARQLYEQCLPQAEFRGLSDEWVKYFTDYVPEKVFRTLLDVESEFACERFAKDVKAPTLVMHGTDDIAVPYADGVYLASLIPGAILYTFAGHGHEPTHTATAEFCDVLSQFVQTGTVTDTAAKMTVSG